MEVLDSPDDDRMLATSNGLTFCRLASSRPVSSRELGLVAAPVPLELDAEELEEDGPSDIFGLGSFGGVAVNGTISNGFLREFEAGCCCGGGGCCCCCWGAGCWFGAWTSVICKLGAVRGTRLAEARCRGFDGVKSSPAGIIPPLLHPVRSSRSVGAAAGFVGMVGMLIAFGSPKIWPVLAYIPCVWQSSGVGMYLRSRC